MTSYLSENEAENLQNGDVHLAQTPDFEMEYKREPFGALRSVMARFFAFFTLFHLSSTFFRPEVPFKNTVLRSRKYFSISFEAFAVHLFV